MRPSRARADHDHGPALVVQTAFLGDVVLTTPLVAHLARTRPVDVMTTAMGASLLANNPAIRETIVFDKRGHDRGVGGMIRMARSIGSRGYTTAYHAQGSLRSAALTAMAGIPRRIGFASSSGRVLYTQAVPFPESYHHAARLLSLSAAGLATPGDPPRPALFPGPDDVVAVDRFLGTGDVERLVAFAPGSVWETKRWPGFAELARSLGPWVRVVIVGSASDAPIAREILSAAGPGPIDATGSLTLLQSAELIRRCRAVVTNDSLPLHLASAMNVPTVAVFGPTVPEFGFAPLADGSFVAGIDSLTCRPCDRHGPRRCPLGHWRCMRDVSPASVEQLLRRTIDDPI